MKNTKNQRIGVYVCSCGTNISKIVDVDKVVEAAKEIRMVFTKRTASNLHCLLAQRLRLRKPPLRYVHVRKTVEVPAENAVVFSEGCAVNLQCLPVQRLRLRKPPRRVAHRP